MHKNKSGENAEELAREVVRLLQPYKNIIKTITTDNGTEFAAHETITKELGVTVYFADAYASWQKGAIENMNGLIRQYILKGKAFKYIDNKDLKKIQNKTK